MKKQIKSVFTLVALLLVFTSAFSQRRIKGIVIDEKGIPLTGATVQIKNTSIGEVTNLDGKFEIELSENENFLIASFIGYKQQEVFIKGKSNITIQMELLDKSLDEVIVTALGITKEEKKVGYSTQQIETQSIEDVKVANVGSLFSGQVAGLAVSNPTGLFQAPSFSLRGKKPLIVIDNIPVETDFYDVSPNDIANISVLKGTTASALYGSRGRNGAILITTKKATKKGLVFNVAHNTMVSAGFTAYPETQTEYGNGSNGKYEFWDGKDGGVSDGDMIWGPKFSSNIKVPQWNSPIYDNVTKETIPWWGDVHGTQYDNKSRYSRVPIPWEYHNNLKDFLQTGIISSSDFSVNYKGEKNSYRFSGNYTHQKDRVPNSQLDRGGLSFKSTVEILKNVTLESKLAYNKVYSPNYPRHGYGPKNHMYTILIWMGDDVNGRDLKEHMYIPGQEGYRQANFNYAWYNNVYFAAYELNQKYDSDNVNGQMVLNYDITNELSLQGRASTILDHTFENRESPKTYLNYGDPRDGDYKTWNNNNLVLDYDILATFKKDITKDLSINVNAGAASHYNRYKSEYNATDGIIVPFVYSLNNTKGNIKGSTYVRKKATNSVYGTIELDALNAFFLTLAARNDWSSTLPKSNRSYFYPSASLSVILSNLTKMPEIVDYLKLFTSWANVSSDLDPYQISSYYKTSQNFGSLPSLQYPSTIINPNIKPENSRSFELGLSSAILKNRINFNVTYYNVVESNQIINLPISKSSGFSSRKVNGNKYTTNGYEIVLKTKPVLNQNFQWNSTINWSKRVRKITEIYGNKEKFGNLYLNDRTDSYYTTVWQKSPDGKLILNSQGLPIKNKFKQNIGNYDPSWRLGFQNDFKYHNLTLSIGIDGVWGGLMPSRTISKMWWGGKHPNSTEYRDAEYAAGKPVYVPEGVIVVSGEQVLDVDGKVISDNRVFEPNETAVSWQTWSQNYPYRASVTQKENKKFANVLDRSFFKLRTLTLKYDLSSFVKNSPFKHLDVSLNGYNLLMWKKAEIVDPDFGNDDNLQDPSTRYIGIGLNAKF